MDFESYREQARTTAIYPRRGRNLAYAALGLADEVGELIQVALDMGGPEEAEQREAAFVKEAGDVLWFVACTLDEAGIEEFSAGDLDVGALEMGDALDASGEMDLVRDTARIQTHAGRVAGRVSKAIRDHSDVLDEVGRDQVREALDRLVGELARAVFVASEGRLSLDDVARANVEKLASRAERGRLGGSGDDR